MCVKFCGTASLADMQCAIDAGCDAVGFIMGVTHRSCDFVTPKDAAKMVRHRTPSPPLFHSHPIRHGYP